MSKLLVKSVYIMTILFQFATYLDQVPRYRELLGEPADYWRALIKQYLIAGARVTVCMY